MQTGLVLGYWFTHEPYLGPLDPQISEEGALATAGDAIASDPALTGATPGEIELATSYRVGEMDEFGSVTDGEWILVWRVRFEDAPETAPAPYLEIDAMTGDLLTETRTPGGQG